MIRLVSIRFQLGENALTGFRGLIRAFEGLSGLVRRFDLGENAFGRFYPRENALTGFRRAAEPFRAHWRAFRAEYSLAGLIDRLDPRFYPRENAFTRQLARFALGEYSSRPVCCQVTTHLDHSLKINSSIKLDLLQGYIPTCNSESLLGGLPCQSKSVYLFISGNYNR